jgi:hypothetical protein
VYFQKDSDDQGFCIDDVNRFVGEHPSDPSDAVVAVFSAVAGVEVLGEIAQHQDTAAGYLIHAISLHRFEKLKLDSKSLLGLHRVAGAVRSE